MNEPLEHIHHTKEWYHFPFTFSLDLKNKTAMLIMDGEYENSRIEGAAIIPAAVEHEGESYAVTSITLNAFYRSTATSVTIPASVTEIDDRAFTETSLEWIVVDEANPVFKSVDGVLFTKDMTKLVVYPCCRKGGEYVIPDTVKTIGNDAFCDSEALTSVVLPDSLECIDTWAFSGCENLTSVVIPDSVKSIGGWAFSGCMKLTSINVPASMTEIDSRAFAGSGIEKFIVYEAHPVFTSVDGVLLSKDMSTLVTFPSYRGGEYVIPDMVKTIQKYAFTDCINLTSVVIPDSLDSIDSGAFERCKNLRTFFYKGQALGFARFTIAVWPKMCMH